MEVGPSVVTGFDSWFGGGVMGSSSSSGHPDAADPVGGFTTKA